MGMAKRSTIVLLPRNKKYAGMLTVETNLPGDEEETDYNNICGSCSSVNTNDHVVVEDVVSDDEDSSVHRFVDDGCVLTVLKSIVAIPRFLVKKNRISAQNAEVLMDSTDKLSVVDLQMILR